MGDSKRVKRQHDTQSVMLQQVIVVKAVVGKGTPDDMCRFVTQYWDLDGNFLAAYDPAYDDE